MAWIVQTCDDCNIKSPPQFFLNDALWESLNIPKKTVLCLNCTEKRLGREIIVNDLKETYGNEQIFLGILIGSREIVKSYYEDTNGN